jgi:predicted alpha-1,2-mannosidase
MFGDGSAKVTSTAYAFGATNFDAPGALAAMIRGATIVGTTASGCPVREGLEDYLNLGYVSTSTWGSVSRTLEYSVSDFDIARLAAALGDLDSYHAFRQRAQNWRNLLHTGYLVPRNADGSFQAGFSPDGCVGDGFIEGSGGQYTFMIRFNARGLFNAFGGNDAAVARLDHHFQQLNAGPCSEFAFMGNEVSLKTPWMYDFAGAPWKTQQVVRRVLLELYSNSPGGMPGNDDGGVMGAWYVFAATGLYPQISGVAGFVIGSPIFPQITIRIANGRQIRISAPLAAPNKPYVQSMRLNGQDYASPWIPWALFADGAEIEFVLGDIPNAGWGTQAGAAPPSYDGQ